MSAERRELVATDHDRVEKILQVLPEADVRHFADELLTDAQYHDRNRPFYDEYDEAIVRNRLFTFDDPALRTKYHELSIVFAALDAFLPHHFFQTKGDVYALYPDWKKSNDPVQKRQWQEKYDELQELALSFQAKYNAFLLQSQKQATPVIPDVSATTDKIPESEATVTKSSKRIHLRQFPRTDWAKVSIRFIGEHDLLLSNGQDTRPMDFEGMGRTDTRTTPAKPDDAWKFLREVAKGNGTIKIVDKKEREKVKKHKQKITDILRKIFQNDTDPFEKDSRGTYTAKFHIEYPSEAAPSVDKKHADIHAVYNEMTEPYEEP